MPRGCKPGQKHSGHFSKGFDPRRNLKGGYLVRERATVEQKFKAHTETALRALLAVLEDRDAPHKDVISAANSLLDRAHGKAVDRIQVASLSNEGGNTASLTRDELMARLTQQYTEPEKDVVSDLEDADEDADYARGDDGEAIIEEADYEVVPAPNDYEELNEDVKYG